LIDLRKAYILDFKLLQERDSALANRRRLDPPNPALIFRAIGFF
jgi:hypothetical protein